MGDVYRESRYRGDDDEDDHYRSTTVRRYKVNPDRYERTERVVEVDDDYRSRYSGRTSGELLDIERRSNAPDRPRSAFEPYGGPRSSYYDDRDDRGRIAVYESKEIDRDWDKRSRHHHHHHDDDIRVEKRTEERYEDPHGHEYERYRKETEYYHQDPPPAPVIVRQRAPEPQKIIVQEAPPPAPIVIPRQEPGVVVLRDKESDRERDRERDRELARREPPDEEYYYRHERREVGPYDRDRDRDFAAVGRYDPRRRHHDDYEGDDDYYVRRTVVRRERSESPHHKRHLAEGALAGAGITALLSSRRDQHGELADHRGRKVIAGAALGALGTEAIKRAHSAYTDRYRDEDEEPDRHSMLKKGLGVAAVALAAAGAAKYYKANKVEKEEASRGRSRRRSGKYSGSDYSRSASRSKSRRRSLSTAAKAAIGTAATAGLVKKWRDHRSKSRGGSRSRSRSKSKIRRAAEIGGAAAAAGVATKMWKNHRDKKDARELSSDADDRQRGRGRNPSQSRSRSRARSFSEAGSGAELGMVEYGNSPLPSEAPGASERNYESEADARRRRRRRRRDRERSGSMSSDDGKRRSSSRLRDMAAAGAAAIGIKEMKDRQDRDREESRERRSRDRGSPDARSRRSSRDRENRDKRRYDRDVNNIDERDDFYNDRPPRTHSPPTASGGAYYPPYPDAAGPPPPMGGPGFNPPYPPQGNPTYIPQDYMGYPPPPGPPPAANMGPGGYPPAPPGPPRAGDNPPNHVSDISRNNRSRDGRNEDDAIRGAQSSTGSSSRERLPTAKPEQSKPEHPKPAASSRDMSFTAKPESSKAAETSNEERRTTPRPIKPRAVASVGTERLSSSVPPDPAAAADRLHIPTSKSVTFIPLSPKSSMTMERHKREHAAASHGNLPSSRDDGQDDNNSDDGSSTIATRPRFRRRRSSDPSSDRPLIRRGERDSDGEEVEVLPDRFDNSGHPLDGRSSHQKQWTSRSGEFTRRPQHTGDWDVKGAWQVGGTEAETVERLAKTMTGVLEGRNNWMQLLGGVMSGGLLLPEAESPGREHGRADDDEDERNAKHRRRK